MWTNSSYRFSICNTDYFFLKLKRCIGSGSIATFIPDNLKVSFASKYDAETVEKGKYERWENNNLFTGIIPTEQKDHLIFSMILPPPNITGPLHLGHALTVTIEDALCRWKRMLGYVTIWVPGTDHAGIATQVSVEKMIYAKSGLTRLQIGRDEFIKEVLKWKESKIENIRSQLKQLGVSLDWSREVFTMDSRQTEAVTEAIIRLYEDGLLYRERTLINWCCSLQSAISDIEIDHMPLDGYTELSLPGYQEPILFGELVSFAMKVCDSDSKEEIVVPTTRIETIFGDTAVAVHPDDPRYANLKGRYLWHPITNSRIPIVFDVSVNPEFGTGAMKVTPAHSHLDFSIGQRHNLPIISIIDENGLLNDNCGEYAGIKRFSAKKILKQRIHEMGLIRNIQSYPMKLPLCSRSKDVVEYIIRPQWFIRCKDMAQRAIDVVQNGELNIESESHRNVWIEWHKNSRDWCISRQLWWGHRLPLYETEAGWIAAKSPEEAKSKAASKLGVTINEVSYVKQEDDVLDTWFSSALLPFSVFGWPDIKKTDLKHFYPLSLMETGEDILCFWISRMVMLGLRLTGKLPMKNITLHGMICDANGRKMSKSLGNVIQPEHVINGITLQKINEHVYLNHKLGLLSKEEYDAALQLQKHLFPNGIPTCGTDALRYSLASCDSKSSVIRFDIKDCVNSLQFCNKMWQACKFVIGWSNKFQINKTDNIRDVVCPWHRWILSRLACTVQTVNDEFSAFNVFSAINAFRKFFQSEFCDIYIELSKPILRERNENSVMTCKILLFCLETSIRLISPVMPFITEELYSYLPADMIKANPVMIAPYPIFEEYSKWRNENLENDVEIVKNAISTIRNSKLTANLLKKDTGDVIITNEAEHILKKYVYMMKILSKCKSITFDQNIPDSPSIPNIVGNHFMIYLLLPEDRDSLCERAYCDFINKLQTRINEYQETLDILQKKIFTKESEKDLANQKKIIIVKDEIQLLRKHKLLLDEKTALR